MHGEEKNEPLEQKRGKAIMK